MKPNDIGKVFSVNKTHYPLKDNLQGANDANFTISSDELFILLEFKKDPNWTWLKVLCKGKIGWITIDGIFSTVEQHHYEIT